MLPTTSTAWKYRLPVYSILQVAKMNSRVLFNLKKKNHKNRTGNYNLDFHKKIKYIKI